MLVLERSAKEILIFSGLLALQVTEIRKDSVLIRIQFLKDFYQYKRGQRVQFTFMQGKHEFSFAKGHSVIVRRHRAHSVKVCIVAPRILKVMRWELIAQ